MAYGLVFAIVILILDERSDPRLLGKMISLASFFLNGRRQTMIVKDARGNEFLEFIYIDESELSLFMKILHIP